MSMSALLHSCQTKLRASSHFAPLFSDTTQFQIMPDEKVPPDQGKPFVGIIGESWSPKQVDEDVALDEVYSVMFAVSIRNRDVPLDREGETIYTKGTASLDYVCRIIIGLIHKKYDIITTANDYITNTEGAFTAANDSYNETYGFFEPLRFLRCDPRPVRVGHDHFYGNQNKVQEDAGLMQRVIFGQARRKIVFNC